MSSAAIELITPARDLVDLANGRFVWILDTALLFVLDAILYCLKEH